MLSERSNLILTLALGASAAVLVATEFVVIGLAPAMSTQLGMSPSQSGWLVTWYAIGSALIAPFLSAYLAGAAPAKVLGWSMLPYAANLLLLILPSFELAAALRVAQGATLPVYISFASALLAQAYGPGAGVARVYMGVTLGSVFAPPLGTFLAARFGWLVPITGLGLFSAIFMIVSFRLRGATLEDRSASALDMLRRPNFLAHLVLSACVFSAMFAGYSYLASLLVHAGLSDDQTSAALLLFGAAGLAGNWLGGRTAHHALPGSILVTLLVAASAALVGFSGSALQILLAVVLVVWGISHAAGFVLCQVRVMTAGSDHKSFAASLNIAAANVGIALGTFTGGRMLDAGGIPALSVTAAGFAVVTVATVAALTAATRRRDHARES